MDASPFPISAVFLDHSRLSKSKKKKMLSYYVCGLPDRHLAGPAERRYTSSGISGRTRPPEVSADKRTTSFARAIPYGAHGAPYPYMPLHYAVLNT